jgi:hypothetical protein
MTTKAFLRRSLLSAAIFSILVTVASAQVLTQHNDLGRTGQNLHETILTTTNVKASGFGKLFSYPVDNQIYAQPLYVPNVSIPGQGTHNVLYVVTEGDSIFAFDADGLAPGLLWSVNYTNASKGVGLINCVQTGLACAVYPNTGITSTPVIDSATLTMYVLVRTAETSGSTTNYVQRLHALNITTGAEMPNSPVVISGSVPGTGAASLNGVVTFNPLQENTKPGIVLANNMVYLAWAGSTHGWIMAYNSQTLAQVAILCTTPNGNLGGLWATGNALAVDASGNLYAATGDGTFDANTGGPDYGDSVIKLSPSLQVIDYFTPMDQACREPITVDLDLGSGGPMLLPTQGGTYPNELVVSGKGGQPCDMFNGVYASPIYLVNANNMGGYNPNQDADLQTIAGSTRGYWSNPAYWQANTTTGYIYYGGMISGGNGGGDTLKQYTVTNGVLATTPTAVSANIFPVGATPSVSANGTHNGIVWAVERKDLLSVAPGSQPAILYAYLGTNIARTLYSSAVTKVDGHIRDQMGCGNKFITPTIANGKVYAGTQNEVDVFGLLPTNPTAPQPTLSAPCFNFPAQAVGTTSKAQLSTLTNLGPGALTLGTPTFHGVNPSEFSVTTTCGASLAVGASCTYGITFKPTIATIPQQAYLLITDNAIGGALSIEVGGTGK